MIVHLLKISLKYIYITLIFIVQSNLLSMEKQKIILIHGFMGWGESEMGNYHYWGGHIDIESYLRSEGFEVHAISVGPISSNWDRAVEAYFKIKGGQVDYGATHSSKYNLIQKPEGKFYKGIHPNWGSDNPIHIITHSQGGQTARMLEYLLFNEFESEKSNLFTNSNRGWIKSITTISCPHNGTVLADEISNSLPFLQKMTPFFGILDNSWTENIFNFDLEQWDINRKENESMSDFINRISESDLKKSKNFSAWDLSVEGAQYFNDIYMTDPDVYYFSYLTYSSTVLSNGNHIPDNSMSPLLWVPSLIIGRSNKVDNSWHLNDGIVSTTSMKYPVNSNGISAPNKIFDKSDIEKGTWQVIEPINKDHQYMLGHRITGVDDKELKDFYYNICKRISLLD